MAGAYIGDTFAMGIGTVGMTLFGGAGALFGFGMASIRSFRSGDTAAGIVNGLGALGGALLIASLFTPVGWAGLAMLAGVTLIGVAGGFSLARWLGNN